MSDVWLRPARSTDAGKIGDMMTQTVRAHRWKPRLYTGAQDIAHAGEMIDRGWVTVLVRGDIVSGFIALEDGYIHGLFLRDDAQGAGLGVVLLNHAKELHETLDLWAFQSNRRARKFYEREGFVEIERGIGKTNDEGLSDIHYRWTRPKAPPQPPAKDQA
ncbi:GNAT family N-acetyltransferase [Tropicibacter naphthalenivorans]|uniref:Putative acetyltransferase n=1 Tax=Tropicibacter naphthalenivorans TaxID=441103 RepID=A0A0P1GUA4_9RHOB|nr:GNAT family N-acetyltransferase [Tropicibacter naphthalenivorans]CUH78135.1 putative acetyltransferase [Tropicibacter naphthalenivorans]SMC93431.1 Acetyltransferase (GNAT) domain-containing protein [Tropicibacter naphthalenivorans]